MHRIGAAVLGVGLCVFGILGLVNQLGFLSIEGEEVLGLSTNGLLSTISIVVGGILIAASLRGGRISSTVTTVVGSLFLLSGLLNLAVLDTELNLLAFEIPNVIFSFIVGMMLLFLGCYGRFSGGLSADNPYYQQRHPDEVRAGAGDAAGDGQGRSEADRLLAAELAFGEGHATLEQERLVRENAQRRADEARRRAWETYEGQRVRDLGTPTS